MENKGWAYYSPQQKHIYYNESGATIKFLVSDKKASCLGYNHVNHHLEYWEYTSPNGLKKRLNVVYLPEENIFMPYLSDVESSIGGFNYAVLRGYDKKLYCNINFLRHAQYVHENNTMFNKQDFIDLFNDIYRKYIENELEEDEDGHEYPNGIIYLGPDKVSYYYRETSEYFTDGTIGNI